MLAVVIGSVALSRKAGQRTASNNTASGQTTAGDNGENGDLPMMPIASGDLEADGAVAQQREKSSAEKSAPEDASDMEDQKGNAQSDDQGSVVAKDGKAKQDQSSPAANIQKPSKPQKDNPKDDAQQNAGTESNQAGSNNSGSSGKTDAKSNNNTSDGKKNDKSDNKDSDQKSPDTIELPFIPAK